MCVCVQVTITEILSAFQLQEHLTLFLTCSCSEDVLTS